MTHPDTKITATVTLSEVEVRALAFMVERAAMFGTPTQQVAQGIELAREAMDKITVAFLGK